MTMRELRAILQNNFIPTLLFAKTLKQLNPEIIIFLGGEAVSISPAEFQNQGKTFLIIFLLENPILNFHY